MLDNETVHHSAESTFWNEVFFSLRSLKRPVLIVSLLFWVLPQLLERLLPQLLFSEKIGKIKDFADEKAANGGKDVLELVNTAIVPAYSALLSGSISLICFLIAYFYLLFIFINFFANQAQAKPLANLGKASWFSFRYGIGFILIIGILFRSLQAVVPFLSFVILPLMLAPVIAILDKRGVFSSSWIALKCSFASQQRFAMYMQVCGIGALFYLGHLINIGFFYWIKDVDHFFAIPRAAQLLNLGSETLSLNLALAVLVEVCLRAGLVALMIATSVCFYMRVRRVEALLKNIGVENYA